MCETSIVWENLKNKHCRISCWKWWMQSWLVGCRNAIIYALSRLVAGTADAADVSGAVAFIQCSRLRRQKTNATRPSGRPSGVGYCCWLQCVLIHRDSWDVIDSRGLCGGCLSVCRHRTSIMARSTTVCGLLLTAIISLTTGNTNVCHSVSKLNLCHRLV